MWWQTIRLTRARWAEADCDQRAAAFAYYLLLSLLPLLFMLVSIGSLFVERSIATREVLQWINHFMPLTYEQEIYTETVIWSVLEPSGKFTLAAFPLFVWGALKFLRTLIRSTNRIWRSPTYNWWRLPLRSLRLLGVTASAVLFGVLMPGVARLARTWLTRHLDFPQWAYALLFELIPWLVLFYGLLMIYRLSPSRPTKFSEVWLGACGATVLLWLGQRAFILNAVNFSSFHVLYGTLGGIVAVLLWLYLSSCLGLLGICFCAVYAERNAEITKQEKHVR
jgi:Ca2+-transporting ATPase